MSQMPTGAIGVQFIPDTSLVDAAVAKYQQGITAPLTFSAQQAAGGSPGTQAGPIGQALGQSLNAYFAANSGTFAAGPATGGILGGALSTNPAFTSFSNPGASLERAASALTNVAAKLDQILSRGSSGGTGGGSGPSSGRSAGGRSGFANFGRYFGIGIAFHQALSIGGEFIDDAHQIDLAQMQGATPTDLTRLRLTQAERWRSGGLFGLNPYIYAGTDWLAGHGINPGNIFGQQGTNERELAETLRHDRAAAFDTATVRGMRSMGYEMEASGILNPAAQRRFMVERRATERENEVNERFRAEERARPQDRVSLENDRLQSLERARILGLDERTRNLLEDAFSNRVSAVESRGRQEVIGYQNQGRGLDAILATIAYQHKIFESSRSRNYDLATPQGQEAANAAEALLDAQGRQQVTDWKIDTARQQFGIRRSTEQYNIMSGRDPSVRGLDAHARPLAAQLANIVRDTQAGIMAAQASGRPELIQEYMNRGRAGIVALRDQFNSSLVGERVTNPGQVLTTGMAGTFDASTFQSMFSRADTAVHTRGGSNAGPPDQPDANTPILSDIRDILRGVAKGT